MDFLEKAKIRLDHWITHNDHHREEYEMFADHLQDAGKTASADKIREMMRLTGQANECLIQARKALDAE